MLTLKCICIAGEHKLEYDEETETHLVEMIKENGDMKKITYEPTGITYLVPIAYILIHGLKGVDLPVMGFEEYKKGVSQDGTSD